MISLSPGDTRLIEQLSTTARSALAIGDLKTAMSHAAEALKLGPFEPEQRALVDEIALATDEPLSLVPLEPGPRALVLAAARIRVLFTLGKSEEALALFCRVLPLAPVDAVFAVVNSALDRTLIRTLGLQALRQTITAILQHALQLPVPVSASDHRVRQLLTAAATLSTIRSEFPDAAELYSAEVLLRRRLPDAGATLAVAALGVARFPDDWNCLTALANALADARRPEEGLVHAERALALRPDDGSPLHDAALGFLRVGRPGDAARVFSDLLARFPEYPGAPEKYADALKRASDPAS